MGYFVTLNDNIKITFLEKVLMNQLGSFSNLFLPIEFYIFRTYYSHSIRLYLSYKNENLTSRIDGIATIVVVTFVSICVTSFFTVFPLLDTPFSFVTEICRCQYNQHFMYKKHFHTKTFMQLFTSYIFIYVFFGKRILANYIKCC